MSFGPTNKTVLITGASSGFGLRTAVTLARRGWRVLATMRDLGRAGQLEESAREAGVLDRIEILPLDVTRTEQTEKLAATLAERAVPLDAIVNNAGFAMAGFADDVSDAELRRQFDVNFFGAVAVTRAFLPQMRRQGFGHVVMVASISGRTGYPGVSSYAASKFALEGWTETLRYEMAPLGIQVALVEPGSYATEIWTRGAVFAERSKDPKSPNRERQARLMAAMQARPGKGRGDPWEVAEGIAWILEEPKPPLRTVFGRDAKMTLIVRTLLPWSWWERLVVRMSGLKEK